MKWLKNTTGKPDAMLTFATIAFITVTLNILMATFGTLTVGDFSMSFSAMDSSTMTAYLAATFTAYVTRRYTDNKFSKKDNDEEN